MDTFSAHVPCSSFLHHRLVSVLPLEAETRGWRQVPSFPRLLLTYFLFQTNVSLLPADLTLTGSEDKGKSKKQAKFSLC